MSGIKSRSLKANREEQPRYAASADRFFLRDREHAGADARAPHLWRQVKEVDEVQTQRGPAEQATTHLIVRVRHQHGKVTPIAVAGLFLVVLCKPAIDDRLGGIAGPIGEDQL